eukprot:g1818.t1
MKQQRWAAKDRRSVSLGHDDGDDDDGDAQKWRLILLRLSCVLGLGTVLVMWVRPWEADGTPGRSSVSQRLMLWLRCFVLPCVCVANWSVSPNTSSGVGWGLSVAATSLWPRTLNWRHCDSNLWSWLAMAVMITCRALLGPLDAWERGRFTVAQAQTSPLAMLWRLWQSVTVAVSFYTGWRFFRSEAEPALWRRLRDPRGRVPPELVPRTSAAAVFALCLVLDAWTDVAASVPQPRAALVVGFWRQVVVSVLWGCERGPKLAVWLVVVSAAVLRPPLSLPWRRPAALALRLATTVFAYVVVCAWHRVSELVFFFAIGQECIALRTLVREWAAQHIACRRTLAIEVQGGAAGGGGCARRMVGWHAVDECGLRLRRDGPAAAAAPAAGGGGGGGGGAGGCDSLGAGAAAGAGADVRSAEPGPDPLVVRVDGRTAGTRAHFEAAVRAAQPGSILRVELEAAPVPLGMEGSFFELRDALRTRCRRLSLPIHYLYLDRLFSLLINLVWTQQPLVLLVRDLPYILLGGWSLFHIVCYNKAARSELVDPLLDARLRHPHSRERITDFLDVVQSSMHRGGLRISLFGFALDEGNVAAALLALRTVPTLVSAMSSSGRHLYA